MRIHVISGPEAVGPFELAPGENVVGRAPECAVALPSRRVSRRHAVLRYVGGVVWVEDAGSANGIFDGSQRRIDREALVHGATFQVGDYLLALEVPAPVEDEVDLDEDSAPYEDEPPTNPGLRGGAPVGGAPPRFAPPLVAADEAEQSLTPALASGMARHHTLVPDDDGPAERWPGAAAVAGPPPLPAGRPSSLPGAPPPFGAPPPVGAPPPLGSPAALGAPPPFGPPPTLGVRPVPGAPPALGPARAASPAPPPQAPPAPAARPAPTVAPPGTPPATARAAEPEGAGPLATAPWNALAGAAAGLTLGFVALVACGQVLGASAAMEEAALQRGEQIADVLGARNAALLAEQRGLDGLDVNVVTERDGVRDALLTDERGTVLAPAKRLRTSVSSHAAWKDAARSRTYARAAKDDGTWEIVAPIRAEVGNAGVKQVVGYAVLEVDPAQTVDRLYGPAGRIGVILLATLMAGGALAGAAWALVLRPLTALRDETELALRGDSDRVSAPVRLAPLEALAHSINRVLARARSRGEG